MCWLLLLDGTVAKCWGKSVWLLLSKLWFNILLTDDDVRPIRFKHMEDVSLDVLSKGGWVKPVAPADSHEGSFSQSTDMTVEKAERLLRAKDRTIEELRLQISRFQDSAASPSPTNSSAPSYDNLTIDKAKRLLKARDSTIAALRSKFQQQQTNSASG